MQCLVNSNYFWAMSWKSLPLFLLLACLFLGCKKNTNNKVDLSLQVSHHVNQAPLYFDTMHYTNQAGYLYEITKLQYYLCGFVFTMQNGTDYTSNEVYYVDARIPATGRLQFKNFPEGNCVGIDFYIGVDTAQNKTDSLPININNINMAWPDAMGGGYHFLKLEGNFTDSTHRFGFAMHLGKNQFLVPVHLSAPVISETGNEKLLTIRMNVNEWFSQPYNYDFVTDGSYSMSNDSAMYKLAANGTDVFN